MDFIYDFDLVNWSRWQFALTAIYHWLFVPLTLGITFLIAIMESIYVKTGNEEWKKLTKFWMKVFGINFAIGVATGIILEFEFGTNWSNYSWFVGDIFGAPLAIEGVMAFFMESTFIALMFFGWNKLSKKAHLAASWLTAIGANLSALWILVANSWMQRPVGVEFNPDTVRNEMTNFWDVLFSPLAISKFTHTVTSAYVLAAIVVIGISAWFLLKKREVLFAKRSIAVAATFGVIMCIMTAVTGDISGKNMAEYQPMKFAAMEGLYKGGENPPFVLMGIPNSNKTVDNQEPEFTVEIPVPGLLSLLSGKDTIPGIEDLIKGNPAMGILPVSEKIRRGQEANKTLRAYNDAVKSKDQLAIDSLKPLFQKGSAFYENQFKYFGYGFVRDQDIEKLVPNIPMVFYSFRVMVGLGIWFLFLFIWMLYAVRKSNITQNRWLLRLAIISVPLVYLCSQLGWVVTEVGRQPWIIQDLMPTWVATSHLAVESVQTTFWIFAVLFTVLLIAELRIMFTQIKAGPKIENK